MTEKLKQTIKEEISQLPKEMQEAINAFDWVKVALEIGKRSQLTEEEINDFQLETLLVLVGAVDPQFYAVNIENHVDTTKDDAVSIANRALAEIFIPIKNILEENIKKDMKNKNPDWHQSIDFILSGGDYSAFMGERAELDSGEAQKTVLPVFPIIE